MIGQTVTWTSQSQGVQKTKTGIIIAIVEPNQDAAKFLPEGLPPSRFKGQQFSRYRRALVAVPRQSGNGCDYYAPRPDWLVEGKSDEQA